METMVLSDCCGEPVRKEGREYEGTIGRLIKERDEARAEVERLKGIVEEWEEAKG